MCDLLGNIQDYLHYTLDSQKEYEFPQNFRLMETFRGYL